MKTNTTYQKEFQTNRKSVCKRREKTFLIFMTAFLLLSFQSSFAQDCGLKMTVLNNNESVVEGGRIFYVDISNLTSKEATVSLTLSGWNTSKNPDGSNPINNVSLDARILNEKGEKLEKILLKPDSEYRFHVLINAPAGTRPERWSNVQLTAISAGCESKPEMIVINAFIPGEGE